MRLRHTVIACAAMAIAGFVQLAPVRADAPDQTVYDAMMNDPRFGTTMKMIYSAGAAERVMNPGHKLTVFAATDTAWDNSDLGGLLASLSSNGAVTEFPRGSDILGVLRGFFVRKDVDPTTISGKEMQLTSAAGRTIDVDGKTMTVKWVAPNGAARSAPVAGPPIETANGVIYPMDVVVGQ